MIYTLNRCGSEIASKLHKETASNWIKCDIFK